MQYLAIIFVLIIIVIAFKLTAILDRREERRKAKSIESGKPGPR